jgi:hypothetical protein
MYTKVYCVAFATQYTMYIVLRSLSAEESWKMSPVVPAHTGDVNERFYHSITAF